MYACMQGLESVETAFTLACTTSNLEVLDRLLGLKGDDKGEATSLLDRNMKDVSDKADSCQQCMHVQIK